MTAYGERLRSGFYDQKADQTVSMTQNGPGDTYLDPKTAAPVPAQKAHPRAVKPATPTPVGTAADTRTPAAKRPKTS